MIWRVGARIPHGFRKDGSGVWNILIGRDGMVIAAGLKGEELMKKVEEAMGK